MKKTNYSMFEKILLIKLSVLCIFIFSCGKKSSKNSQIQKNIQTKIAPIKIFIKWPYELNNTKQAQAQYYRIPLSSRSIKITITGPNIKNSIESTINKENNNISELSMEIPVGLTYFEVTAFEGENASSKKFANGEVVYNILPDIINEIKISLKGIPDSISISPDYMQMKTNEKYQLIANVYDVDGFALPEEKIIWEIENNTIAKIDSTGMVTGLKDGSTYINATAKEIKAKAYIQITDLTQPQNISVLPGNKQITLKWSEAKSAISYSIYYSFDSTNFSLNKIFLKETYDTMFIHTNLENGKTYFYEINAINQKLSESSNIISACPTDTFLYITCEKSLQEFAVDKNTGNLFKIADTQIYTKTDSKTDKNMALSYSKKMLYVLSCYNSGIIYQFSIDEISGKLNKIAEIETGTQQKNIKIDPEEKSLYIANYDDNTVSNYDILDNGDLAWKYNLGKFYGPNAIAIHPLNYFLFIANYKSDGGKYYLYKYNLQDTPIYKDKMSVVKNITSMLFSPNGDFIYMLSDTENRIDTYSVKKDGNIILFDSSSAGYKPGCLTGTPQGKFMYSASYSSDYIVSYKIDEETGIPYQNEIVKCGSGPQDIIINPENDFLYVANSKENTVSIYKINPLNGTLTFLNKVETLENPNGLCLFSPIQTGQVEIEIE
ncbi:MAG: beta-propeller fold lactonase family protein [Candidatus Firestonebacteria bacterium]|nr:beta-propeller fold lactonase family protein [Candidatus Firestonebacteria bacterium]